MAIIAHTWLLRKNSLEVVGTMWLCIVCALLSCLFIAVIVSKYFLYSDAGSNHVKTFGGFNSTDICKENLALVFKKQGKNMPLSPVIVSRGLLLLLPEL